MEIWKQIENFTSYEVSNTGYVRRRILFSDNPVCYMYKGVTQTPVNNKYVKISISRKGGIKKTLYMKELVANYFLPNPNNYNSVKYKTDDILNNHVDNLEWYHKTTPEEKMKQKEDLYKEKLRKKLQQQLQEVLDIPNEF